jgi:predicted RNase H-like HicB family nuclease
MVLVALVCVATMSAQTDRTGLIQNPSFEKGTDGWMHSGMSTCDNNIFSIKQGNIYMERWTGRGGAVGSGSVSQEVLNLPPGNYELTVAAQNIQEDTPTKAQTGTYIYAEPSKHALFKTPIQKTTVTVRGDYTVAFNLVSGSVTIGFEAQNASGNWISVDNFRLKQVGLELTAVLAEAVENAETTYGNVTGKQCEQLLTAIANARTCYDTSVAQPESINGEEQAAAIVAMENAIDIYLRANASAESPLDMTDRIKNPSFETGDLTYWTASGMGTQGNSVFSIKKGTWYVERWTGRGGKVGDARLSQQLTNMPAGRYRLKAAVQNIQEDTPQAKQTGAWIFAGTQTKEVDVRGNYTLEFVQVADVMEIGFEAKGATGNWLAVDNFQLEYISDNFDDVKEAFSTLIAQAEVLAQKHMTVKAKQALTDAIAVAKPLLEQSNAEGWSAAATDLEAAMSVADTSQEIFARLADAIATATDEINKAPEAQNTAYQEAINTAQGVYDAETTTNAQAEAAITALDEASFAYKVLNGGGSGQAPVVVTDTRFVRGATWAFGRSTVTGEKIIEEGFCWSESPDPKVTDNRTTEYLNQAGKIYWLRNLKPATIYYMRAYAINSDYGVGYGDVIKFVTVPKGTIGHWYNNGGDEATNDRLNYAINTAIDYYWNNLSSIHGFGISVTYSPGTQTADCSYGGSMRVGASSSYQQVGTIMHEAFHGIGVGTHNNWWSGDYRTNGIWMGDRVTEALRFWDNNTDGVLAGDDMHLWPYGCNGAHEDTHNDNLYCMMGILAQALNEDGLPGSGAIGYALPYYAFNQEDGVKYYIKNEDTKHGLHSAYLVETNTHQLQWKTMTAEEAATNDAAAWYITFTPSNQYYQLKNASTGYYMTYSSGIKTVKHTTPTAADDFHLMRGRVDVEGQRGYYIIHPESSSNPPVLNATASGKTATTTWNIANSATTQRWLILTAEEALNFDNGNIDEARDEFAKMLTRIRKLAETPHVEDVEDADATLSNTLSNLESQAETCTKGVEVDALTQQARSAAVTFLSSVSVTDVEQPFDLTFMIENPDFDKDATSGWTTTNSGVGYDAQGVEFYEKTFNFHQVLDDMPSGTYELRAYAFQRPGDADAIFSPYSNGTAKVTTSLYMNSTTAPVCHICDDRQSKTLFNDGGWGSDKKMSDGTYIPNCMVGAEKYFAKGLYDSSVCTQLEESGSSLRVGIKCTSAPSFYWTMFDHFRLFFFGGNSTVTDITSVPTDDAQGQESDTSSSTLYMLDGRKVKGQPVPGIYIVGKKKVMIRK